MKKLGVLFILLLILNLFIISISALESPVDIPQIPESPVIAPLDSGNISTDGSSGLPPEIDKLKKQGESLSDKEKREYLFKELQESLLKKKYIKKTDEFLKKIDIVFVILFGEHYELSGTLLMIIILWPLFFYHFSKILDNFSAFSEKISWVLGFAMTVAGAQLGVFRKIAEGFIWLIFYKEGTWWRFIMVIIIIIVLVGLSLLGGNLEKSIKEKKEKEKLNRDKRDIHEAAKTGRRLNEATGKE